jgi:glutaredoxin 3
MLIEIYTKPSCSYCNQAKRLLESNNIPYTEHKLNVHFTREQLLKLFPTAKTYPVVVIDGFNIGGYTELNEKLTNDYQNTQQLLNEQE